VGSPREDAAFGPAPGAEERPVFVPYTTRTLDASPSTWTTRRAPAPYPNRLPSPTKESSQEGGDHGPHVSVRALRQGSVPSPCVALVAAHRRLCPRATKRGAILESANEAPHLPDAGGPVGDTPGDELRQDHPSSAIDTPRLGPLSRWCRARSSKRWWRGGRRTHPPRHARNATQRACSRTSARSRRGAWHRGITPTPATPEPVSVYLAALAAGSGPSSTPLGLPNG